MLAARERRHRRHPCRRAGIWPWTRPTAIAEAGCSMAWRCSAAARSPSLVGGDQRADPVQPLAPLRAPPRPPATIASMPGERHDARVDRLTAGRLVAQLRDRHVAVQRQHQRARDRRRGHHQQVGLGPWPAARAADGRRSGAARRSPPAPDRRSRRRPGTGRGCRPRCWPGRSPASASRRRAAGAALAAGEQRGRQAERRQQPRQGRRMLARQDLGRRHAAPPGSRPRPRSAWPGAPPASCRCRRRPAAGAACARAPRGRRRSRPAPASAPAVRRKGRAASTARRRRPSPASARPAAPSRAPAQQRQRQLVGEQLVEGEPAARGRLETDLGLGGRPVDAAQGVAEARPALAPEPGRGPAIPAAPAARPARRRDHARRGRAGSGPRSADRPAGPAAAARTSSRVATSSGWAICQLPLNRRSVPLTTRTAPLGSASRRYASRARKNTSCSAADLAPAADPVRRGKAWR